MKVFKFGGASVKEAASFRNLLPILRDGQAEGGLLIVVSAMGKTTNALEEIFQLAFGRQPYAEPLLRLRTYHEEVAGELFPEAAHPAHARLEVLFEELNGSLTHFRTSDFDCEYDQVIPYGELLSSALLHFWLLEAGLPNFWLDCRPYLRTDDHWREANVDWEYTEQAIQQHVAPLLKEQLVVTQGFIGGTREGLTTTLGREGSDYTAAIFAYCLEAASMTIWKDVAGILNADPKLFPDTLKYEELSFQETIEMAYYGASVIHPKTIQPLARKRIPLYVKSFLDPAAPGTCIHDCRHERIAPAIILKQNQTLVSVSAKNLAFVTEQHLSAIFRHVSELRLKLNLMQNSAVSFSFCFDEAPGKFNKLVNLLRDQFHVHYNHGLVLFTVKNYDEDTLSKLIPEQSRLLLEQRTRTTYQAACRPE